MLKFQENDTIILATFEDFILTAYVIIDELYKRFAPPEVTGRKNILGQRRPTPKSSQSASVASWLALTRRRHGTPS